MIMNGNQNIGILLEFLYNDFAITFIFCFIGAFIRRTIRYTKVEGDRNVRVINTKKIVTSILFSTFLICAITEYIELPFNVFVILSVLCGMWGMEIVNIALNEQILMKFFIAFGSKFKNPIIKSASEITSEILEDMEEEEKKKEKEDS